jgi:hypothetical protein
MTKDAPVEARERLSTILDEFLDVLEDLEGAEGGPDHTVIQVKCVSAGITLKDLIMSIDVAAGYVPGAGLAPWDKGTVQ